MDVLADIERDRFSGVAPPAEPSAPSMQPRGEDHELSRYSVPPGESLKPLLPAALFGDRLA